MKSILVTEREYTEIFKFLKEGGDLEEIKQKAFRKGYQKGYYGKKKGMPAEQEEE